MATPASGNFAVAEKKKIFCFSSPQVKGKRGCPRRNSP